MARPAEDNNAFFQSLHAIRQRLHDGTFKEILEDWRWIFSYSKRYKLAIVFYTLLGVFSTTFGLVASVAGKYAIDIILLNAYAVFLTGETTYTVIHLEITDIYSFDSVTCLHGSFGEL